jgi:hypothetical protein
LERDELRDAGAAALSKGGNTLRHCANQLPVA